MGEYRREFLRKVGAAGSVALGVSLAGCEDAETKMNDDPNQYDYTFVEGDDLARNLAAYDEKDVTTQTTVQFEGFLHTEPDEYMRHYTATPDDTIQTFNVAEKVDGPIYQILGEELDTETHHDVELQLYGFVDLLRNEGQNTDESSYVEPTFMVEDAERVQ